MKRARPLGMKNATFRNASILGICLSVLVVVAFPRPVAATTWEWVEPIINGWGTLAEKPNPYAAGTWGPSESFALLARDGFSWVE